MDPSKEKTNISTYLLLVVMMGFISCRTTILMRSMDVEILKPASFLLPDKIDTIAVLNRKLFQSDTIAFQAIDGDNPKIKKNNPVSFSYLSNKCVEELANSLESEGFFLKVINYSDSMNYLFPKDSLVNYPNLHQTLGADAFVFLDYFNFDDQYSESKIGKAFFMATIKENFPEFKASSKVERISSDLLWTISFKGDSSLYSSRQLEDLYYGNSAYPEFFGNDSNKTFMLENTAQYLGKAFVKKIIPGWEKVTRNYYQSHNVHMLVAEKYLLENDWLKAAEIYNKQTNNKNRNIAAKARYNMAVICEIEGKFDAATDWLERSKSTYKKESPCHIDNCTLYMEQLSIRQNEISLLEKQVR